jgi:hypothetical protein
LLTKEDEIELSQAYEAGLDAQLKLADTAADDPARAALEATADHGEWARRKMIESNLRLAVASGTGAGGGVRRGRLVPRLRGRERLAGRRRPDRAPGPRRRYAAYASGLAIVGSLVLVLKLAGAAVALAAVLVRPGLGRRPEQLLGVALWGAFGLLGLYSAGNLAITVGTVGGLLAPSAAWTAAGGVTPRAIGYVLFFLAGAALFGVLAVWFHRRHHLGWTAAVAGLVGAPLLLGLLLAAVPALLGRWGLLPT